MNHEVSQWLAEIQSLKVQLAQALTPLRHFRAIADNVTQRPRLEIQPDDVMILLQPRGDSAADQSRRSGDQYPHATPPRGHRHGALARTQQGSGAPCTPLPFCRPPA